MIRYDVLYKKLHDHIQITMSNASFNAGYYACKRSGKIASDEYLVDVLRSILKESDKEFDNMQKQDEEAQHNANVTLQEILQELKKLNKGKEDKNDSEDCENLQSGTAVPARDDHFDLLQQVTEEHDQAAERAGQTADRTMDGMD